MGSPFASPFARVTRSGRAPSCSNAKKVPVRPTPVWISSEAEKRRERCRSCDELALERDHAAFAENRLEENDPDVVLDSAHESVDVVRLNEAHSRDERRERLSLPRLPRRRKGTERPPVEASLERDDT